MATTKNLIKKILSFLIDIISLPFEFLLKFVKNADNILVSLVRLCLLLIFVLGVTYIVIAKPYRMFSSNFYFEKYKTLEDINKVSIVDNSENVIDTVKYLESIGSKCEKKKDNKSNFYDCFYTENRLYKKYKWGVFLRYDDKNIITYKKINRTQVNVIK